MFWRGIILSKKFVSQTPEGVWLDSYKDAIVKYLKFPELKDVLKAIKLSTEEVNALRKAAHWGVNSKATAEKALKSKRKGYISDKRRYHAKKTIEIFDKITA